MVPRCARAVCLACAAAAAFAPGVRGETRPPVAYTGRPFVRTFRSIDIHSSGPVQCFAQAAGMDYFVGSEQLSVFDGSVWRQIEAPGLHGVRGLAYARASRDGGSVERVWVAARTAIGYVERNEVGIWNFTSLGEEARSAGIFPLPAFLDVAPTAIGAIFAASSSAVRWDGSRFERIALPASRPIRACAAPGGGAWIWQQGTGLLRIGDSGAPTLVRPASQLPDSIIVWMLPSRGGQTAGKDGVRGFLLGTSTDVYSLTEAGYERLGGLSDAVGGQFPNGAAAMAGDSLAINTLNNGVVFGTRGGEVTAIVNHLNGLRDDAVYALWPGLGEETWVGLDDGCQRISARGRVSLFDSREGLERGAMLRVLSFRGLTYVVTNKAVYTLHTDEKGLNRLAPVFESNPGITDAAIAGDAIWVGGYLGMWRIGERGDAVLGSERGPVEALATTPEGSGVYCVQGGNLSIVPAVGRDQPYSIPKFGGRVTSMIADRGFGIWFSTEDNTVFHFVESPGGGFEKRDEFAEGRGLPARVERPVLSSVGGRVLVFTDREILQWKNGVLEGVPELADWVAIAGEGADSDTAYWIVRRRMDGALLPYSLLRVRVPSNAREPIQWESLRCVGLDTIGQIERVSVTHDAGGDWLWIGGNEGLIRAATAPAELARSVPRVAIREVRASGDSESFLPLMARGEVGIGPNIRQIGFSFSPAEPIEPGSEFYQTRLEGIETAWSGPTGATARDFTGLAPGHYVFAVRRVDRFGNTGQPAKYPFLVQAAWYQRWPAEVAAVAVALAGLGMLLLWRVARLRRQTARLDRLVAERTRALELSNVARSEFLESISHEIRNPLNGLTGLLGLLDENALPQKDRKLAESLRAVAAELTRIFDQVLNFSKAEYGYVQMETGPFSLRDAIGDAIKLAGPAARKRGCELTLEWVGEMQDGFEGDAGKIRAIVGNLIGNAVKYAPGPIRIVVLQEPADNGVSEVVIEVIDRGPGIPQEEQELIFEKFVRGSNAKRERIPGTGLGLPLCRAYARLMGGSIHVESRAGAGSAFLVQLPLRKCRLPESSAGAASGRPVQGATGLPKVALVLEDEAYNRLILTAILEKAGWEVETAEGVNEAIEKIGGGSFDAVLLDLELPDGKGLEVARFIRSREGSPPIVIATTGHDSDEIRERCRAAGMDGFLLKPYSPGDVNWILTAAAAHDPAAFEPRSSPESPNFRGRIELSALLALDDSSGLPRRGYVGLFAEAVDEEIGHLERALGAGDGAAAAFAAHRLRALSGLVGCDAVTACAKKIEAWAVHRPDDCREPLRELRESWRMVRAGLVDAGS